MYSARKSAQAVALFFVSGLCTLPAYPQTVSFLSLETKPLRIASLTPAARPSDHVNPVAPCSSANAIATGCGPSVDAVRQDLNTMGKRGQKILQARDKVLEILQTDNACSEWYRTKDADPAATFRTLTFSIDLKGENYTVETWKPDDLTIFHNPYVASVLQAMGAKSTVTINGNGAFFFPMAGVVQVSKEGGPLFFRGPRELKVGPYPGGTVRAQVLALLHEFGHVLNLLPEDFHDYEGKSRKNTEEVLRFCRAQVESREAPGTFLASR
jgi:hypothetical protein